MPIVAVARVVSYPTLALTLLLAATPSVAQPMPCVPASPAPLAFDPYKPSHLAIVRNYGGAMLAQVPIDALLQLDPYVPAQGELLRQVGRGIPAWPWPYVTYAPYPPVPLSPPCEGVRDATTPSSSPPLTTFSEMLAALQREATAAGPSPGATAGQRVPGIAIQFAGRRWVAAGPAVPFVAADFERISEPGEPAVFRRRGGGDAVIYIPTTPGMAAPFRAGAER